MSTCKVSQGRGRWHSQPGRTGVGLIVALTGFCLSALTSCASIDRGAPLVFDATTVGVPGERHPQTIYLPTTPGLHPAIMVLSKCWASDDSYEADWAQRLASWGYVTLIVDSLRPRLVSSLCRNQGNRSNSARIPTAALGGDVSAAVAYLRARPDVDPARVGVLGVDAGGVLAVLMAQSAVVERLHIEPVRAIVATSPLCDTPEGRALGGSGGNGAKLVTDLLILSGAKDDFDKGNPICRHFSDSIDRGGHSLEFKVYADAFHLFDTPIPLKFSSDGYWIGRNEAAALDSQIVVREFLEKRLSR